MPPPERRTAMPLKAEVVGRIADIPRLTGMHSTPRAIHS